MSNSQRREEKKRRREKRLAKRDRATENLEGILRTLQRQISFSEPRSWPGVADPSLKRPDLIKFELATFVENGPGRAFCRQLERQLKQGLLDFIPEIEHWGMEEFFWHGLPGNPSHPIDQFLQTERNRFPAAAREQLAPGKTRRIGCYEIGAVADDLVSLREVNVLTSRPVGPWVRAIALNIGGVNIYAPQKGKLNLTYLAPWAPDENIYCVMGYGMFVPRGQFATVALLVRGMRSIQAVTFPLPWRAGKVAARQCFEQWRDRDWFQFMATHVRCPFAAVLMTNERPN